MDSFYNSAADNGYSGRSKRPLEEKVPVAQPIFSTEEEVRGANEWVSGKVCWIIYWQIVLGVGIPIAKSITDAEKAYGTDADILRVLREVY